MKVKGNGSNFLFWVILVSFVNLGHIALGEDESGSCRRRVFRARNVPTFLNKTVLVGDDDPLMHFTHNRLLKAWGFSKILRADNGDRALTLLERESINIVITDFDMPGMNGIELSRRIKEAFPNLPVLLNSSMPLEPHEIGKADRFIRKASDNADFQRVLVELLENQTSSE